MAVGKIRSWLEALGLRKTEQICKQEEALDVNPDGSIRPLWRSSSRVEAFLQNGSALDPDLAELAMELGALGLAKSSVSKLTKPFTNQPLLTKEYASELVEIYRWQLPLQTFTESNAGWPQIDLTIFEDRINSYHNAISVDNFDEEQDLSVRQQKPQIWVFLDFQGVWEDRAMVEIALAVGRQTIFELSNLANRMKPELPIMIFPLVDPWAKVARIAQTDAGDLRKQTAALHHQVLVAGEIANIANKQGCLAGLVFDSPVILRGEVDKAWILELSDSLGILVGYALFGPLLEGSYPAELGALNPYLSSIVQPGDLQRTRAKFDLVLVPKPCGIRVFPISEGEDDKDKQAEIPSDELICYLKNLMSDLDFGIGINQLRWEQISSSEVLIRLAQDIWNDFDLPMAFYY